MRNPNGHFQHRNWVEYIPSIWKIHCTVTYFEGTVRDDFATVDLESKDAGYFEKLSVIGHPACLPQRFNLVLHNWMKMDLKNEKLFRRYVEHLTQVTKIPHMQAEMDWGSKNQILSFFSNQWLILKMKKWKIDEMKADTCRNLVTSMTAIGAFF
jgi:hypothetical protein